MPLQIFYNRRAPSKWMLELVNETVSAGKDVESSMNSRASLPNAVQMKHNMTTALCAR